MRKLLIYYSIIILLLISIIGNGSAKVVNLNNSNINPINQTSCEQQLQNVLDLYNNCSYDYHKGENCGTVMQIINDTNKNLVNQRNFWRKAFLISIGFIGALSLIVIMNKLKRRKENGGKGEIKTGG